MKPKPQLDQIGRVNGASNPISGALVRVVKVINEETIRVRLLQDRALFRNGYETDLKATEFDPHFV